MLSLGVDPCQPTRHRRPTRLPAPASLLLRRGSAIGNAIDAGSNTNVTINGDSTSFTDTALSGFGACHSNLTYNASTGDGADVVSL